MNVQTYLIMKLRKLKSNLDPRFYQNTALNFFQRFH